MKTRMTVKWIHEHVSVNDGELPGSVHGIKFNDALSNEIESKDWMTENYNEKIETRVMKRLEKLGYIKFNGMYQLTTLGYRMFP